MNRAMRLLGTLNLVAALCASCGPSSEKATAPVQGATVAENAARASSALTVDVVKVRSLRLNTRVNLPGELLPFQAVAVYPKVTGFVEWMGVDRGSRVKKGQLMGRLVAPELTSQRAEAEAKLQSIRAQLAEAEAKLASDQGTYARLKAAAATPGVVSGNELETAQKAAEADRAHVQALQETEEAAKAALRSVKELEGYLSITAPFDAIVTERNAHPGVLVGPAAGTGALAPLLRIEQNWRLRLVVPVPEMNVSAIAHGTDVTFKVPAFPAEDFHGRISRIAHSVDTKTRTMPVELDVLNPSGRLAAGMFPQVSWPVQRPQPTLFVPASVVARTTEQAFVVRVRNDMVEWVTVKTGATVEDRVEVFGDLHEGDWVALRGTDELRPGTRVTPRLTE